MKVWWSGGLGSGQHAYSQTFKTDCEYHIDEHGWTAMFIINNDTTKLISCIEQKHSITIQ